MEGESGQHQRSTRILLGSALAVLLTIGWAAFPSGDAAAIALTISQADWDRIKDEFPEDAGLSWIERETYNSCITQDPDGHAIELHLKK